MSNLPAVLELVSPYIQLAQRITNTNFVPKAYRGRPEETLACLLTGAELGLGPMESLRAIYVVDGRPTLSAEVMRALVLAAGHELIMEASDSRVTMRGRRTDSPHTVEVTWTLDMARRANLDGKENWRKYPRQMLTARATAELCRVLFADVVSGLGVYEEAGDEPEPPKPRKRRASPVDGTGQATTGLAPSASLSPPEAAVTVSEREEAGSQPEASEEPPEAPESTPEAADHSGPNARGAEGWLPPPPPWADPPPEPTGAVLSLSPALRALHAEIGKAWPDESRETIDRYRHTLAVLCSRKRPGGPVSSSAALSDAELAKAQELAVWARRGALVLADDPPWVEVSQGPWRYRVDPDTAEWHTWKVPPDG